jgi:hypothetical protein
LALTDGGETATHARMYARHDRAAFDRFLIFNVSRKAKEILPFRD